MSQAAGPVSVQPEADDHPDPVLWLLAQVKPGGYDLAARNLQRQSFVPFMPRRMQRVTAGRKKVDRPRPLFPGYVFVGAFEASPWRAIAGTYGISRLVTRGGGMPQPVPHALVDELRARCGPDGLLLPPSALSPGDAVRVLNGPFAELVARVECMKEAERVGVLVEMMGQAVRLELPAETLDLIGPGR
jgi:transcriptional antiterminator RfaH